MQMKLSSAKFYLGLIMLNWMCAKYWVDIVDADGQVRQFRNAGQRSITSLSYWMKPERTFYN